MAATMRRHLTVVLTIGILLTTAPALAQEFIPASGALGACNFVTGEFNFDCIPIYVGYLVKVLFAMTGGFALIEIVKSGYEIALSGVTGDKEKGKKHLTWALLGLALSICAFLVVDFIISTLLLGP